MTNPVRYHSDLDLHSYFYNQAVCLAIQNIDTFLDTPHEIHIFPEATIKNNQSPNGILLQSRQNQTILLPTILRDPGCGFLLFKLIPTAKSVLPKLAKKVLEWGHHLEQTPSSLAHTDLLKCIELDESMQIEVKHLAEDLHQITNSLELKINSNTEQSDIWGCLHTGSDYFPSLIQERFFTMFWQQCIRDGLASLDAILRTGLYGIRAHSTVGVSYRQWIQTAMNFCAFKRIYLFNLLKEALEREGDYQLELVHDRCHAGLFTVYHDNHPYDIQSRGVQMMDSKPQWYILAGQRESKSYLLKTKTTTRNLPFIGHGTSYRVDKKLNYSSLLGKQQADQSLQHLNKIWANTNLDKKRCLAYEYNISLHKAYLSQFDVELVSLLPFVNYQGPYLRDWKNHNTM